MLKRFTFPAVCTVALVVMIFGSPHRAARASDSAFRINQLNQQITELLSGDKPDNTKRRIHGNIAKLASERFELLSELASDDAARARRSELPKNVLQAVPADLKDLFESEVNIEGELQVIAECEETNGRTLFFVETGKEKFQLNLTSPVTDELKTGMWVSIKGGTRVGEQILVEPETMLTRSSDTESASLATLGEKKVLVLLVNFQDNPSSRPFTVDQVNNLMFNRSNPASVTNYYLEASYGQTWIAGDTAGYFTLPMTSGQCDATGTIANLAKQAATNAGINVSAYSNHMYVFPNMGCSWAGWGEIGGKNTWIDGSLYLRTTAHELGHNFGLFHSRGISCSGVIGSTCTTTEYGHVADMIGTPGVTGNFNPYQKERLGWLNYGSSPAVTTVQSTGMYTIGGLSVQDTAPKALKILKSIDSSGRKTWYYVEFRRPVGFDSFVLNDINTMNGVLVTMNQESNGVENYLLDMVPSTAGWGDSALLVGSRFEDPAIGLTIAPLSVSDAGAVVSISLGGSPCVMVAPTISADPIATQWINPGGSATYNVQLTNNNSSSCQSISFNFGASVPSGWTWSTGNTSLNLPSGGSGTLQLFVTPSSGAASTYNISMTAANAINAQYSSSVTREIGVRHPITVTVSTNQSTYASNQTVTALAHVSTVGSAAGIPVSFTMEKPNGRVVRLYGTTSSAGDAKVTYRLNKKQDPPGVYTIQVIAESGGSTSTASTSFTVR